MGFAAAFDYGSLAEIFREHAALSAFENDGSRLFDIGGLADIGDSEYQHIEPRSWPVARHGSDAARLLGRRRFPTPDGRARFAAVRQEGVAQSTDARRPLALNSGRLRDQWHTMTRTGLVPRLMANAPEPAVKINPTDALASGCADGDLVQIDSPYGFARARVKVSDAQKPGTAFLPMHWSGRYAANAGAGSLASPICDAFSGQLKHVPVRILRETVAWSGVTMTH